MQQRGAVVMQSRAGLLQPVRVDPKKQRAFAAAAKVSRAGDGRRMAEQHGIGDTGQLAGDRPPPHLRRGHPQELAARRQMQREMQEPPGLDPAMAGMGMPGGMGRGRGGAPRPIMVPVDKLPPEMARQLAQGPVTLHLGNPPPYLQPGYFPPGSPKHFSSKSSEPPDKARQGPGAPHPPRRGVGAMAHLASPVRVNSSPTGVSPREHPPGASPRELHLSSPRNLANTPRAAARDFAEDNTSGRYSSDAEKTPRSGVGRQEGGWKASPRLSAEAPMSSPRGALAQGDSAPAPEGRRGVPKDRGDERLLRNLNLKAAENRGGRIPDRAKLPTNPAGPAPELDATSGRMLQQGNPHMAGGGAIYQMDRKAYFGRGGAVGPPHSDSQGVGPQKFHVYSNQGLQTHQMPTMTGPKMTAPKVTPTRAPADNPRMASQRKPPTVLAKKTAIAPPKPATAFSPALLIASPATSPMNSPRPSLMPRRNAPSKNTVSGKLTNAANASPGGSPTRVPKAGSPRNSPARTYVISPKDSPTDLPAPAPARKTPARSPQAISAANLSTKLQLDSAVPQTTTSTTAGKDRKGKYQNPKTRLSAGGDLQTAKGRPKTGPYRVGAGEAASPPGEKSAAAPTAQTQPPKEVKEPSDFNKGQIPTKASPLVRKLTKTSLLPVHNPATPRSVVSQHLPEEELGKSGNTVAKQTEGTPRRTNPGEGNKKFPLAAKNRKGAITGTAHTEGVREAARGKAAAVRHRRGGRGGKESLDVAAALPDTSGNYTSAVHQWLRQSHYKVISPQQYRQHETIQEETVKQTGLAEKAMAFKDERPPKPAKPAAPETEKATPTPPPAPEKGGRRGRLAATRCEDDSRSISPFSTRYHPSAKAPRPLRRAPLSLLMTKHKDVTALPKMAATTAAARAGKKASKAAAAAPASESSKRKAASKRGLAKGIAKGRGARRKKDKDKERPAKLPPSACPRLRPKVGPAGDSGDLSSSSEGSSYLSASDEAMNEQSTMC